MTNSKSNDSDSIGNRQPQWTTLSAKSQAAGRTSYLLVPEGLNRSENVKNRTQKRLQRKCGLRQPMRNASGRPLAGQRDKHSQVGQLFQGALTHCPRASALDRILGSICDGERHYRGRMWAFAKPP